MKTLLVLVFIQTVVWILSFCQLCHVLLDNTSIDCPNLKRQTNRSCSHSRVSDIEADSPTTANVSYWSLDEEESAGTGQKNVIHLAIMMSFPDSLGRDELKSVFDDGHDLAPAAYLAVEQVNNRSDLLRDYEVRVTRLDGGCSIPSRTTVTLNELVCSRDAIVGIVGPSCDRSSRIVSQFTNREEFSMVSVSYMGGYYNDSSLSFSVLGANRIYHQAIAKLISFNKWTNSAALLYSAFYKDTVDGLLQLVNKSGYRFKFSSIIYDQTYLPLDEVKNSLARIIVLLAAPETIVHFLCIAFHSGMVFPKYQWIFTETVPYNFQMGTSFTFDGKDYTCSDVQVHASVYGSINILTSLFLNDGINDDQLTDAGFTIQEYRSAYEQQTQKYSKTFNVSSQTSVWANGMYDAVWLLAIALNNSLPDFNRSLTEFRPGSRVLAEGIRKRLLDIDFLGVSGPIQFDVDGYNRDKVLNVCRYCENGVSEKIGTYASGNLTFPNSSDINLTEIFISGELNTTYIHIGVGELLGLASSNLVTLVIVVIAQCINTYYRHHRAIKASSPALNHLIFLGCYSIIIGILLNFLFYDVRVIKSNNDVLKLSLCTLYPWFLSCGVTLFLGTVCAKTWRLNRIYKLSSGLRVKANFIESYHLTGFVCILLLIDILICLLWYFVDPLEIVATMNIETTKDAPVRIVEKYCTSEYPYYWVASLLAPKVLLIMSSFLLALSTNINIKEFKTSNIIILAYFLAIIFGLGIPIYVITLFRDIDISVQVSWFSICLDSAICVGIILLFLPFLCSRRKSN